MTFPVPAPVSRAVHEHPYPLIFATVSGAHLYGFASPDSDWDLRGVHLLPADDVLGLLLAGRKLGWLLTTGVEA
jgi:predicted nucleotidyltransferase